MAQPIRWDNVGGANLSEASRPLDAASNSFNGAFAQLQSALASREAVDTANYQNTKANNTNAYLDAVSKLRTPEELAAAQAQGGALDQLRAQFGNQVDANAIRGATDARLQQVMDQKQKQIAYDHVMTDERVAPLMDQFKAAALKGDQAGMDAAQAKYSELGGRDLAGLTAYRDARTWEINQRGMTLENHQAQMDQVRSNILHNQNSDANAAAQTAVMRDQAANQARLTNFQIETGTEDRQRALAAGQAAALGQSLRQSGNLYADGMYNGNQVDDLRKFMKDNKIGGDNENKQANIISALTDIAQKGVEIKGPDGKVVQVIHDIPLAAVKAAIGGAKDDLVHFKGWNNALGSNVSDALSSILSATTKDANGNLTSKALDDLRTYTDATQRMRDNAPGIRSQGPAITSLPRRK